MEPTTTVREQILDHAITLMMLRGYNGFSYRDLSELVGVKTSSIHYYFPSKEDLAALDALLNPATTPRPLEPAKAPSKSGRWEPQFQSMAKPRRPARRQVSPIASVPSRPGRIAASLRSVSVASEPIVVMS